MSKKAILDKTNQLDKEYSINTGRIYKSLCKQWKSLDKGVIDNTEQKIKTILITKKLIFIPYSENSRNRITKLWVKNELLVKGFDIFNIHTPTFLFKDPITSNLYKYSEQCVLNYDNDRENFEYFFALKITLLKPMRLIEFLNYQLKRSFNNNRKKFNIFLSLLAIEYKSILTNEDTRLIINGYFKNTLVELELKPIPTSQNISTQVISKNIEKEITQKYETRIFTSYRGFQIFEAFKNEIITERYEYAGYGFLFNNLKKDGFIHEMRHQKFMQYLSEVHGSKILDKGYAQFNASSSERNIATYARYKKQFQ